MHNNHTIEFIGVKSIPEIENCLWLAHFQLKYYNKFMCCKIYPIKKKGEILNFSKIFIRLFLCWNLNFWNQSTLGHVYLNFGRSDILRFYTMYIRNIKGNFHCQIIIFIKANIPSTHTSCFWSWRIWLSS